MKEKLKQVGEVTWQLPVGAVEGMRVPALVFLSRKMMEAVEEGCLQQIANVATLPGIHQHAIALPDMHFGYS